MKRFVACRLTVVALMMLALSPSASAESYLVVCRGGPDISISHKFFFRGTAPNTEISIDFRHGSVASGANGENLNPGQCSWSDRGMFDSEPTVVVDQNGLNLSIVQNRYGVGNVPSVEFHSLYDSLNLAATNYLKIWVTNSGPYFLRDQTKPLQAFTRP